MEQHRGHRRPPDATKAGPSEKGTGPRLVQKCITMVGQMEDDSKENAVADAVMAALAIIMGVMVAVFAGAILLLDLVAAAVWRVLLAAAWAVDNLAGSGIAAPWRIGR